MKVYVDKRELPTCCFNCPHSGLNCADGMSCYHREMNGKEVFANFSEATYRHEDCPLQSLQDHDKEVRKQVCYEIRKKVCDSQGIDINYRDLGMSIEIELIHKILDQIEKGSDCDKNHFANISKNVETAWVVQNKNGLFLCYNNIRRKLFSNTFYGALIATNKSDCERVIKKYNLEDCKPVKVEIKVVEE